MAKEMIRRNNPKVLIVHNQMKYYGGAELLIVELANWMTKMGIKNDILALSKSKEVEHSLINTDIITLKNDINLRPPGYRSIREVFKSIWIFRKKLKKIEKEYDVINFHDFPVTWTLWPRKKAAVWFMNLPPNLWSKPNAGLFYKTLNKFRILADRFIVRNSIDIIAVAEEVNRVRAKDRYGKNSKFVSFGINYDFFSKGDGDKAIGKFKLKDKFVLIHSGILNESKNQLESVKTVKKLKGKIQNILLIISGKDDDEKYREKIEDYIKKNNLEENVVFIGMFDSRDDLRDLYSAVNVGLFPLGSQGGVLAPLEVLSAGVPIVVSEELETASLIRENGLGIVTKDYYKAVLEIYENEERFKEEALKASKYIRDNLSWKRFTERMVEGFRIAWKKY